MTERSGETEERVCDRGRACTRQGWGRAHERKEEVMCRGKRRQTRAQQPSTKVGREKGQEGSHGGQPVYVVLGAASMRK